MSDTVTAALIAFGGVVIGYIFNMITDYIKNKHENQRIELSLKADEINSRKSISVQYITSVLYKLSPEFSHFYYLLFCWHILELGRYNRIMCF